jgi:superfamily II DNA or RNA helicase
MTFARQHLRPYQIEAKEAARAAIRNGQRRVVLTLPTGAGKTTTAADMIESARRMGKSVLFLAHRRELIDQCSARLDGQGIDHGIIMAGTDRRDPANPVQVASIQTLRNRELPPADLVFVDECHLSVAPSFVAVLDHYEKAAVIGLTATPYRLDGKGLGRIYNALVQVVTMEDLIEQGSLIRPRILSTPSPDLSAVRTRGGDYEARALAAAMDQADLVGDIVGHWQQHAGGGRTVVFASSVAHSIHLAERFRLAGVKAAHIDAKTPGEERKRVLAALRAGDLQVVCNVEILTAGWDLPALEVCVLARPTQSLSLYLQMAGRVLRPHPGKAGALILDHAGCAHDHGLPEEARDWSLIGPKDNKEAPPPSVTNCPVCYLSMASGTRECPACGYPMTHASGLQQSALPEEGGGELVEFTQAQRMANKRARFFELVAEADRLGYRTGWAAVQYKAEFGTWPGSVWKAELKRRA